MFPDELKRRKQWVCWRGEEDPSRPGKLKKMPVNPFTGGMAQSNNPSTWSDYYTALEASKKHSGLGFMFGDGIFGIDIDDIEEDVEAYKNGESDNVVAEFIHSLESYSEYSVSGNGIHIICKGSLPEGGRRKGRFEMYSEGRFFIMTGDIAAEYFEIADCTETVKFLHAKYIGTNRIPENKTTSRPVTDIGENELMDIISKSKQSQAFMALYHGQWQSLYPSQSEADMAFSNMLAFWTGCDRDKMDSIFRKSGLMREKWESRRKDTTYGAMVLDKAIADCRDTFSPGDDIAEYSITIGKPAPRKMYSMDDTGNAERFQDQFKGNIKYSYINKCWYFYNGKKWQEDDVGAIKSLADDMLKEMKKDFALFDDGSDEEKAFTKHYKYTRNNKGKTAMVKEVEHRVSVLPAEFDARKDLMNVQNGFLCLRTGKLEEHRPDVLLSKVAYSEYTDHADCPQWMNFLNDIFDGDLELIDYIQRAVGYSMAGSTKEQCMFFLYGNGRNGKSTFIDTISSIMGDYAINIQPDTIMVKNQSGGANSDIARLKGARLVTTVEPNEGARLNEGLVKQLTGGDKVTARHLYSKEFEFEPEFKIWMSTNHKPIIRGRDVGIWRRMHLIPFTVEIPEHKIDKNLKHKLKKEYMGILHWMLEGCLKWQRNGLGMPEAVKNAVNEYKGEMDVVSAFLDECTERGPGDCSAAKLYNEYVNWANSNGEYKMSNTKFGKEVGLRYEKKKRPSGMVYVGVRLKHEYGSTYMTVK